MKQEDYRACISKGLKGKTGLSKEERKLLFCTQSKLCSGKAQTKEEALTLCAMPKGDNLSCKERIARVHKNIDAITLGLKAGNIKEMVPVCAQILSDVTKCRPGEVAELASVAVKEIKDQSKDAQTKLEALKALLN